MVIYLLLKEKFNLGSATDFCWQLVLEKLNDSLQLVANVLKRLLLNASITLISIKAY